MNLLITGSRSWTHKSIIHSLLKFFKDDIKVLIHGGAKGADSIANHEAQALNIPVEEYPALWSQHGRKAGMIRNQQMLNEANPDTVWAFPTNDSIGTWDMVRRAKEAGLPVFIVTKHPNKPGYAMRKEKA